MKPEDVAKRADRIVLHLRGHQRMDCLRRDLIQEISTVYQMGIDYERARRIAQRDKTPNTQRQAEVLEYYISFRKRHGYIPSYTQIARHFGLRQKATVCKHIKSLRRQGFDIEART